MPRHHRRRLDLTNLDDLSALTRARAREGKPAPYLWTDEGYEIPEAGIPLTMGSPYGDGYGDDLSAGNSRDPYESEHGDGYGDGDHPGFGNGYQFSPVNSYGCGDEDNRCDSGTADGDGGWIQ